MNKREKQREQPKWLTTCLAAASAVLSYRIAIVVFQVFAILVWKIPVAFLRDVLSSASFLHAPAALAVAMLFVFWQHQILRKKSLRAKFITLAVFALLGGSPLELQISSEPVYQPVRAIEEEHKE